MKHFEQKAERDTRTKATPIAVAMVLAAGMLLGSAAESEAACIKIPFLNKSICTPSSGCISILGRKICTSPPKVDPNPNPQPTPKPSGSTRNYASSKRYKVGNCRYAGAELSYNASVYVGSRDAKSKLDGYLKGCFATASRTLAQASLTNEENRTRVFFKLGGKTVYSRNLSSRGSLERGPYTAKVGVGGKLPIVPGLVSAFGRADIGAGAKFNLSWYRTAFPPRADLTGKAKAFANGSGEIGLSALDIFIAKLASASLKADLKFLNPEGQIEARTALSGFFARARVVIEGFKFYLKGKVKALCVKIPFVGKKCAVNKSRTLINSSGGKKTFTLFSVG